MEVFEMSNYEDEGNKRGEEAAEALSNFVNSYNRTPFISFVDRITHHTHRTLQQLMFRLFYACIKSWAECYKKGEYDLRNEDTCRLSNEIVEYLKDKDGIAFI